jgi:hypothetical protein
MRTKLSLCLFALAATLQAQNPNTPVFPAGVATDNDLPVATNNANTTLAVAINATTTTIVLSSASRFVTPLIMTIDSELLRCATHTGVTYTCTRGFDSSTAATHPFLATVRGNIVDWHINQAAAEIKAIEGNLSPLLVLGADCTGATNSTTAFAAYIAAQAGKTVTIPANCTLLVTPPITLTAAGTKIIGSGPTSVVKSTVATGNTFVVQANDIQIKDLKIQGVAVDDTTVEFGIFTAAAAPALRGRVEGVTFDGLNDGLKLDSGNSFWTITENTCQNLWGVISGTGYCFLLGLSNSNVISGNHGYATAGKGRHMVYAGAGSSYNIVANNIGDGYNEGTFVLNTYVSEPASTNNVFTGNISTNAAAGSNGGAAFETSGKTQNNLFIGNAVFNSQTPCWSTDSSGLGANLNFGNQFIDFNCQLSATSSTFCGRIGGAVNTIVQGGLYVNASSGAPNTYPCFVVQPGAQGTTNSDLTDGTQFIGVRVVGNANMRSAIQINATLPYATNTYIGGGNVLAAGGVATIENPANQPIRRGINPASGTTSETIDTNPLIMPTGYVWEGTTTCSAADACTTGSGTNGNAIRKFSGDSLSLSQGVQIKDTHTGGGTFNLGEFASIKSFQVREVGGMNWSFNANTGNIELAQGGILGFATTFAGLGACFGAFTGLQKIVADAMTTTFGSVIVGGGSNVGIAICNGTNWIFH